MLGQEEFIVTEWNWFKAMLRLTALESMNEEQRLTFSFDDNTRTVDCNISRGGLDKAIKSVRSVDELYHVYFRGWIDSARAKVEEALEGLPVLSKQFRIDHHATFSILKGYGMGSIALCTLKGDQKGFARESIEAFWSRRQRPGNRRERNLR